MIVLYDNSGLYPNLIWDDDTETVTAFRINTSDNQQTRPFEIFCTNYEHIQHIEAWVNPITAKTWVDANITDEEQKKLADDSIKLAIQKRSYTGTTEMRNIYHKPES